MRVRDGDRFFARKTNGFQLVLNPGNIFFDHTLVKMTNDICSPQPCQYFNNLNYYPKSQCTNNKKGLVCINSNYDTNIVTKYDWAVKLVYEEFKCSWCLYKTCSNPKSQLKYKISIYNHYKLYHHSNNNNKKKLHDDSNTN